MGAIKKVFLVFLSVALVITGCVGVNGNVVQAASTSKGSAETLPQSGSVQSAFDNGFTMHWYKFIPESSQYYRFTFRNQSAEVRTGISIADDTLNLFLGKMTVTIYDSYDEVLAEGDIRCGYSGSVSLKMTEGQVYYISLYSTVTGNYNIKTRGFADVGGDTWDAAEEVEETEQIISSIEAKDDKDWFWFSTDSERSYYDFSLENISVSGQLHLYLYEYVEGAGETPLREVFRLSSVSKGYKYSDVVQLKANARYYYCIYGSNEVTGGYQLDVAQTVDAVGNTMDEAYQAEIDTKITTSFEGTKSQYSGVRDVDYVMFKTAEENAYYHFNYESLSVIETDILVYDLDGNKIGSTSFNNTGKASTLSLYLESDSIYYLCLEGTSGNYNFSIDKKTDTYYDVKETATEISYDKTYQSSFEGTMSQYSGERDVDYVKFTTAEENAYYHVMFRSLNVIDADVILYDEVGSKLVECSPYGEGTITESTYLNPNTTYYLYLKGTYGYYEFSISKKVDAYYDKKELATDISLEKEYKSSFDGTSSQYFGERDVDYLKFTTLEENVYYHIWYESLNVIETDIILYDETGGKITERSPRGAGTIIESVYLEPNTTYYLFLKGTYGNYKLGIEYDVDYEGNSKDEAVSLVVNELYEARLEADDDVDWYTVQIYEDGFYRIRIVNESCRNVYCKVYTARDREMMSYSDDTAELSAGTYYIKVNGYQGYYSVVLADCGSGHIEKEKYTVQASTSSDGSKKVYCASCGKDIKTEKVRKIDKIEISASKFTCNGKVVRPTISVKDSYGNKITSYNVKWSNSNSKLPGKYTVTITFKGAYKGSKTFTYYLNLGKAKVKAKKSGKKINVTWSGAAGANKFEIYRREYNAKKKKWGNWKKVNTTTAKKYVDKKAKKGKYYQYYVKASYGSYTSKSSSTKKIKR